MNEYVVPNGMALSVFHSKYSRKKSNGEMQTYAERISEVITGNFMLDPRTGTDEFPHDEYNRTKELAIAGIMPTSGRHLQHGDRLQPERKLELFSNCSTAMFSFMSMRLLLQGSGVGRDFSSACCRVDWDNMPDVRLVMDESHPDFKYELFRGAFEPLRDARHKYDSSNEKVRWFEVEDSREGWAKIIEILETAAWQEKHADKLFIFDFSKVRAAGVPIKGMQNRPASGPISLMEAIARVASIKNAGMKPWKQALFIDHYLASCVQFGGVRRSARMSVKHWRDRDIIEFIDIKRGGFLWSSNNSILVDKEFWEAASRPQPSHARRVFEAVVAASYWDATGEPGFINVDSMNNNMEGVDTITADNYISKVTYPDLHPRTVDMIANVLGHVKQIKHPFLTNPCFSADTLIVTSEGAYPIEDLVGRSVTVWDGNDWRLIDNFRVTGQDQPMVRITLQDGSYLRVTPAHSMILQTGERKSAGELEIGDKLLESNIQYDGPTHALGAYLKGFLVGDGTSDPHNRSILFLYAPKHCCAERLLDSADEIPVGAVKTNAITQLYFNQHYTNRWQMCGLSVRAAELSGWSSTYKSSLPAETFCWDRKSKTQFLAGLFDADGCVVDSTNGFSYQLSSISLPLLHDVQTLLKSIGVRSKIGLMHVAASKAMPGGTYDCQDCWRLTIGQSSAIALAKQCEFSRLKSFADRKTTYVMKSKAGIVVSVEDDGIDDAVYCCTVPSNHSVTTAIGITTGNCGEINLSTFGGYCVIGDICLANCNDLTDALDAADLMSRFLIRTNLMPADYTAETKRTNRIGVAITGVHEFAWTMFGLTFRDMISYDQTRTHKAHIFWKFIDQLRMTATAGAADISKILGLNEPHTVTTVKPSGTISKVMDCTEGVHLPALRHYLRWVQYKYNDPDLKILQDRGYPVKDISHRYPEYWAVGFPTKQRIVDLMGAENVVTADETTPEENFKWLQLLEQFWLGGGVLNNQVSYTLKYDPQTVSYLEFMGLILQYQPTVRCCSVMPQSDWKQSEKVYGYVPEQPITHAEYDELLSRIDTVSHEGYDANALECASGVCPIETDLQKVSVTGDIQSYASNSTE